MSLSRELNVLMVTDDRDIFREGSAAHTRIRDSAAITERLHVIALTSKKEGFHEVRLAPNCIVYPTNSFSLLSAISDARAIARRLFLPISQKTNDVDAWQSVPPVNLVVAQNPFLSGIAAYVIARTLRRPFHVEIRDDIWNPAFRKISYGNAFRVMSARFLLHRHADVRAVSTRIKTAIFSKIKFLPHRFPHIAVFPDFVDVEKYRETPPSFDLHGIHPGFDLLALVVARLEREKNISGAIRILREAHEAKPGISAGMVIVGSGSKEATLRKYAKRLGLGDRVFFYGWQNDLVSFYKTADLLVVTSLYEGYGKTFMEAAASGCPILTRDVGMAKELLGSANAIVCADKDEDCLRRNITNLADNADLRQALLVAAQGGSRRMEFRTKEEYYAELARLWEAAVARDETAVNML